MKKQKLSSEPLFYLAVFGIIISTFLLLFSYLKNYSPIEQSSFLQQVSLLDEFILHEKKIGRQISFFNNRDLDSLENDKGQVEVLSQGDNEPRELTIWVTYNEEQFTEYLEIANQFSKMKAVKLNISRIPFDGQQEKFQYACNSHSTPDIARMDIGNIARFAVGKALIPMESFAEFKVLKTKLMPQALSSSLVRMQNGEMLHFGIPDEYVNVALFINKDLFLASNLEPKAPTNWHEFEKIASILTKDLDGDGIIDQYGFAQPNTLWWSLPFLYSFNADIIDAENLTCNLNEPAAIEALEYQISLTNKGIEAGAFRAGSLAPDAGFKNGRYAMIFSGPWNFENFRQSGLNFEIDLIPGNQDLNINSSTSIGGNANVIFRKTKSPKLAFEFLSYLASYEVQKYFHESLGSIPINLPEMEANGYKFENSLASVFIEQAQYAKPRPAIPGYARIETIVNNEVEAAFSGSQSAKEAYSKACLKIEREILNELKEK